MAAEFVYGMAAGSAVHVALQPLDTLKTRIIDSPVKPGERFALGRLLRAGGEAVRQEGWRSLWKGSVPTALRVGLGGGIYFSLLEALAGDRPSQQRGSLRLMFAAAAARTAGFIATAPILVVKTRFEADRARGRSLLPTLLHLARSEGLRGLYAGFGATLLRDVPLAAIYVPLYTSARSVLAERFARGDRSHGGVVFVSGLAASAVASAVTQPADVVRTRLQLEPAAAARAASTLEAMRAVAREGGGVRGFFAGVVPRTLKRSLASGLTWLLYEKLLLLPRPRSFG